MKHLLTVESLKRPEIERILDSSAAAGVLPTAPVRSPRSRSASMHGRASG